MPSGEERIVTLPKEVDAIREKWLKAKGNPGEQERIYKEEFGSAFAPLFAELPLHGAPEGFVKPRYLVSVLGMSWQPVALMGAWVKPEKWLILTTGEARKRGAFGEGPLSIIRRISGVPEENIELFEAADDGEVEIYRKVREFLDGNNITARDLAVDITGGKKSMSIAAGLAGFLSGARIVYVEYGRNYSRQGRIPDAGFEYPRLLSDPLEQLGDIDLDRFTDAFNAGEYQRAQGIAERLKDRLYESREAECLYEAASGYAAWDEFRFDAALESLRKSLEIFRKHGRKRQWRFGTEAEHSLEGHVALLEQITSVPMPPRSIRDGMPFVLNHLSAAMRLRTRRPGLAVLLCYATIEKYVDLCLLVRHGLDPENPDYERVKPEVSKRPKDYEAIGRLLVDNYSTRELQGPLMFINGLQLLSFLSPDLVPLKELPKLRGLSRLRNKSEYAHGSWTVGGGMPGTLQVELNKYIDLAKRFLSCGMLESESDASVSQVEKELDRYRFPRLEKSGRPG